MSQLTQILLEAENVKPIAEKDGKKIVTFNDAAVLASKEGIDPSVRTGVRKLNPDGSPAGIITDVVAINPSSYFANRYKLKGKGSDKMLSIITDWRAINEQSGGKCYAKTLTAYLVARDDKKELYVMGIEKISDSEFLSEYTNTLDISLMSQIVPLISEFGADDVTSEMPI